MLVEILYWGEIWMERPLSELKDGTTGVVCEIRLDGRTRRRLIEMGITPGAAMRVKRRAPLGLSLIHI